MAVDILREEKFITRLKRRLGWPKIDVELDKTQFQEAIHSALNKYSEFFPKITSESLVLYEGTSVYTLETERIYGVLDFMNEASFLDIGINFGEDVAWQIFGGTYGYSDKMGTLSRFTEDYVTRIGTFEMAKNVFRSKKMCRLYEEPNKIIVLPKPTTSMENAIVFVGTRRELTDLRFEDEDWVFKYSLALCKVMLGEIRSKYGDLPTPMGNVTLNGETLKSEGNDAIINLEEELTRKGKATILEGYNPH